MKFWPFILTTALLAGCAHYQSRPLAPEKSAAQIESRRLDNAALKKFFATNAVPAPETWPLVKWDLDSLTLAAFYFHPDLAVARAQWLVANAGVKTAGGRPNPTLSVSPQYNSSTFIPSPWGPSINLDIPIETMGKRSKRIAEAEQVSESARWQFVSAAWQVRSNVRAALGDFRITQQRLPLLQKQLAAQREIVSLMQGSFDAGAATRPELTAAQMALAKLQLDATSAEAKLAESRTRLAEAIGISTAALKGIEIENNFSANAPDKLNTVAARHAALVGRADIRAALADYAAAENNLRLEIAKQFPDVHLNPGYQFDQGDNKWSLGLTVELPVFNQNQGPIAESRARRELAAAKFLQLQAQVIAQVERTVAGWQSAQTQLKTAGELFAAAERQQKSVAAQVKAGAASKIDLAAAEIELASIRLAQLDSVAQAQAALGALEDALQSPADSIAAVIQKFPTKGSRMKNNCVLLLALALALAGCSKPAAEKPADAAEKAEAKSGVTMDAETQSRIGLKIEVPAATQWQSKLKVSGRVLDPAPLMDLLLELGRAQMTFDASHAELERAKQLKKDGNISERAFQDAEMTYRQNATVIGSIRYKLLAGWGRRIAEVMTPDVVPPGTKRKPDALMEKFPESLLLIRADLPTGERTRSYGVTEVASLSKKTAPVQAVQLDKLPALDPQTQQQSVLFYAESSPTNLLVPGEAVTLSLVNSDMPEAGVVVPASAVVRHDGAAWVYAQTETNQFSRVEISLDCAADGGWFVKDKFSTNSRIVVEGAQALLSAEFSSGEGGHEH